MTGHWDQETATAVVARGYDEIAERYRSWTVTHDPTRAWFLGEVAGRVPEGAEVLELGCGSGVPVGAALATRYRYLGVDVSSRQIELARRAVPGTAFQVGDLTALELEPGSVDAVVACYVMGHVPLGAREDAAQRIAAWLRPGGWFCGSVPRG